MLAIRFLRIGKKHQPSYKIVVVDKKRSPKSGKFIERLGFYNPITKEKGLDKERVQYWLSQGAQPSDTLHNLLVKEGIIEGKKLAVHSTKKRKKEEIKEAPTAKAPAEEAPKEALKEDSKVEPRKEETKEEEKEAPQEVAPAKEVKKEKAEKKPEGQGKQKKLEKPEAPAEKLAVKEDKNLDKGE